MNNKCRILYYLHAFINIFSTSILFLFILISVSCTFYSCGTIKYVYLPGETKVEYRDTTIYKDSIQYTPVEVIKEIVPLMDTLKMSTSLAEAEAYVDTTNRVLRGSIKNKKGITNEVHYKEKIVYRDSVVTQSYPVEVEKPVKTHFWYEKILWFFSVIGLASIIILIVKLYVKSRLKVT